MTCPRSRENGFLSAPHARGPGGFSSGHGLHQSPARFRSRATPNLMFVIERRPGTSLSSAGGRRGQRSVTPEGKNLWGWCRREPAPEPRGRREAPSAAEIGRGGFPTRPFAVGLGGDVPAMPPRFGVSAKRDSRTRCRLLPRRAGSEPAPAGINVPSNRLRDAAIVIFGARTRRRETDFRDIALSEVLPEAGPRAVAFLVLCLLLGACSRSPAPGDAAASPDSPISATLCFVDRTESSGIDATITSGVTPSTQILEVKGGGLALLDGDADGDLDLLVPNGATLAAPTQGPGARYFENLGGLRFRDATAASGLRWRGWSFGTAVGDYDADGQDDVFVAGFGRCGLLRGVGGGRFEDVTETAGVAASSWCSAAAFGDLDGDQDLDLYVVRYLRFDPARPPGSAEFMGAKVFAGPKGLAPEADLVFENRGDGSFRDVTGAWGFDRAAPSYGLGVVILDFDGDGRNEVYVGNDSQANFLFVRDDAGRFTDVGLGSGIGLNEDGGAQATMGIAIGDVDQDARPDVFTTNFMNDTNTLHVNLGRRLFDDRTVRYGLGLVSRPFVGWATAFFDFDHDADEDLVVFNGHTYPAEITDSRGWQHRQAPLLFERRGTASGAAAPPFRRVLAEEGGPWLAIPRCSRSACFADLDQDGDIDLLASELNGPVRLLENVGAAKGRSVVVTLRDRRPGTKNPRGLGARIALNGGGLTQHRWLHTGGSYQASTAAFAHFGVPAAVARVDLDVVWPDGVRQQVAEVAAGSTIVVERR